MGLLLRYLTLQHITTWLTSLIRTHSAFWSNATASAQCFMCSWRRRHKLRMLRTSSWPSVSRLTEPEALTELWINGRNGEMADRWTSSSSTSGSDGTPSVTTMMLCDVDCSRTSLEVDRVFDRRRGDDFGWSVHKENYIHTLLSWCGRMWLFNCDNIP